MILMISFKFWQAVGYLKGKFERKVPIFDEKNTQCPVEYSLGPTTETTRMVMAKSVVDIHSIRFYIRARRPESRKKMFHEFQGPSSPSPKTDWN